MFACINRVGRWLSNYGGDRRGAAGLELALVLTLLLFPIVNVIDFGIYLFETMEVSAATDAAAQAAVTTCGWTNELPAWGSDGSDGFCSSLSSAATTAGQSTSLGSGVTISFPASAEGYYCIDSNGILQLVATPPTARPGDCSVTKNGSSNDAPGDYLKITASYTYAPLFSGISLASAFSTQIAKTVWVRLQ